MISKAPKSNRIHIEKGTSKAPENFYENFERILLKTPFEFDCGVYEKELEDANTSSQNLCNRVILSILKNWQRVQAEEIPNNRMIRNIELDTYSPMGYVPVTGKSDKVPITGVVLNVYHVINWQQCCREINQTNGD